ncbi:Esterase/lipase [Alteromonadaceae bacterium Bs31]|nr:Esterase/lipase [Alteromonadaceae bacterium Bs31]
MTTKHLIIKSLILVLLLPAFALAQYKTESIWPGLAPGSENIKDQEQWSENSKVSNVYQPNITPFLVKTDSALKPALLIVPGGGYRSIAMNKEGYKLAQWANENGISAFVLKYRLNEVDGLRDAQRAMSYLRKNAKKFNIDENKIGVMGFSAGAHLSGLLTMNRYPIKKYDQLDTFSPKPNFWIPVYGVFGNIFGRWGSHYPIEDIPPIFIVHADNDSRVPSLNSVDLYSQLKRMGASAELHIYEYGEHGFALEEDRGVAVSSTVENWSQRCIAWLKVKNIL